MSRILFIGHVWPEPTTTAAGNRMLQLLKAFLERSFQITFSSTASKTGYSQDLASMNINEVSIAMNDSSFDRFVEELNPEIVVFDRFMVEEQFGWRVAEKCPTALRILNTEDLHSLREFRGKCTKKHMGWTVQDWLQQEKTKREIASIYRSDLTLLVSSFEKELLKNEVGIDKNLLLHLPFMLPGISQDEVTNWPGFENRRDFISFGNGRHAPNVDSFKYLRENIWPLIRVQLPEARLHLYGAYLPQQVKEMHSVKEGFLVHGWIQDLEAEVQKSRVVLAPLRFGAGIKGKLVLAMQNGTPNVTTPIGVEGMTGTHPWPGFLEEEPEDFANRAVELYLKKDLWQLAQKRGIELVNSNFNMEKLTKAFFKRIEVLVLNLENHRTQNFIGRLLQHQSMAATKFMGKWIEEKNKRA